MLLRIIYIVVLWVFVDQVFLDSEGLYQIPDLTALDTRHNIFISGSFSHSGQKFTASKFADQSVHGSLILPIFERSCFLKTKKVMIIATLVCILAQILLYFVLKDGEFCKKILLYLMTFIFFSSIVLGMFLLLPRKVILLFTGYLKGSSSAHSS